MMKTSMASLFLVAYVSLALVCICQADLISDVCSGAQNPPFCQQTLRSDPRSRGADLRGLAKIVIEKSRAAVQDTARVAKSFDTGSNKGKAETCIENCNDAVDSLNQCMKLLPGSDEPKLSSLQTQASAALTDISTCDDEFGAGEPPKLKTASKQAQDLISVLLTIVNRLVM